MTARPPQAPSLEGQSSPGLGGPIVPFPSARPRDGRDGADAAAQSQIFRQTGAGRTPTIVIAGFLPDATESIEYQRDLVARYGDIYYVNYPRNRFCTRALFAQVGGLIRHLNARGEYPVLFSICFGAGLVVKLLCERGAQPAHAGPQLQLAGVVMVSPILCAADMVRLDAAAAGAAPLRERAARTFFLGGHHGDLEREVARTRRAFGSLFRRERATRLLNDRNAAIIARVLAAVHEISVTGYYERALALRALSWPSARTPIFRGPALVLFAEDEDGVFVPTSPTLAALRTPSVAARFFPRGAVHEVASSDAGDPVVHGSIVVHHRYFNPFITAWYDRLAGTAAV
ncbi:MAG TPA: alpha/beta hydrolase [bacterium]|nr:alpha/beta hydrolase [bacterium]